MRRERMSRPSSSVPHQWVDDGPARRVGRSMWAGSCGAIQDANKAQITKIVTRTMPIAASGLPRAARRNEIAVLDIMNIRFLRGLVAVWKICSDCEDLAAGQPRMRLVNQHL